MVRTRKRLLRLDHREPGMSLTRRERLIRWAELLEREPDRLFELSPLLVSSVSGDSDPPAPTGSPLDLAYRDPVLRIEGLRSASASEARAFFQISAAELHRILGRRRRPREHSGRYVAWRIRNVGDPSAENRLLILGLLAAMLTVAVVLLIPAVWSGWHG